MVNNSGSSPVIVMGLDPGIMYTVKIKLFDGDQVVMSNITVTDTIIVSNNTGKILVHSTCAHVLNLCIIIVVLIYTYICTYEHVTSECPV